jgi:hypothetical protein
LAKHVVTLLAAAWKDLDEEDQAMWKERAERIKAGEGHLLDELEVKGISLTNLRLTSPTLMRMTSRS